MSARGHGAGPSDRRFSRGAGQAWFGAGLALAALVLCWYLAFHVSSVARVDARAYFAFDNLGLEHAKLDLVAQRVTKIINPSPFVYLAAVPVILAMIRRRWGLALGLAVMIPGAIVSSELLKPLLEASRPATGVANTPLSGRGSWPSGHATAAAILAASCLLASPARWRPQVASAGILFVLVVVWAVLSLGWHYPSDVIGGILVASIWTLGTLALSGSDPAARAARQVRWRRD